MEFHVLWPEQRCLENFLRWENSIQVFNCHLWYLVILGMFCRDKSILWLSTRDFSEMRLETFCGMASKQAIQWNVNFFGAGAVNDLRHVFLQLWWFLKNKLGLAAKQEFLCASNLINSFSHAKRGKMSNYSRKNLIKRHFFCFSFLFPVLNCIVTMPNKSLQSILKKESVGSILWTNVWTINLF